MDGPCVPAARPGPSVDVIANLALEAQNVGVDVVGRHQMCVRGNTEGYGEALRLMRKGVSERDNRTTKRDLEDAGNKHVSRIQSESTVNTYPLRQCETKQNERRRGSFF